MMKHGRPDEWEDAKEFDFLVRAASAAPQAEQGEERFGRLVGVPYLHRQMVPLGEVRFNPKDKEAALLYGMGNECSGHCGV
jgi:hypothetical protein